MYEPKPVIRRSLLPIFVLGWTLVSGSQTGLARDALPSWNAGAAKRAIVDFVAKVTREGGPDYVAPTERIAVFDNDGTLWAEQPMCFQLAFALDRVKALAPMHPEWKQKQPFKAVLEGDLKSVLAGGEHALLKLIMATHAGNTTEEFSQTVKDWLTTAKHPMTGRPYTDMVYQPMLELLAYRQRPAPFSHALLLSMSG